MFSREIEKATNRIWVGLHTVSSTGMQLIRILKHNFKKEKNSSVPEVRFTLSSVA